jgi:HAE1 family hydrophobic/amphiphilic exporter-1
LIGTFAIMQVLGFSINTLTLFGLTLATGLVVDDAIVVIENIARFIQQEKMSPLQGAAAAMDEISGAVVASSLVLLAVFVPVAFFPGTTGQLYRQFALTIAGSITISLIVALTLTPVLSRLLLSNEEHHNRFFDPVNRAIDATRRLYGRLLPMLVRGRTFVVAAYVVGIAATVFMNHITPTGFLPNEDQGFFFAQGQTADEASLPYTADKSAKVGSLIASFPEVADVLEASGQDFLSTGANRALFFVNLKPWAERGGARHSLDGILQRLQPQLATIPGMQAIAFNPPAIQGFANVAGFQFELEDRSNNGLDALNRTTNQLLAAANANPALSAVYDTFRNDAPQLVVDVDREKVESLGIPLQSVFDAMEISLGSLFVNQFDYLNRSYRVYVQADAPYRSRLDAFDSIYVHATGGASVPLSTLVHVSTEKAAPIISHYNLFRSVEINGSPAAGRGSGEALAAMQQTAERILPHGMSFEWSGLSLEQLASGAQGALVFVLGIVVVFLVLAAKYESLTDPLTILLAVPLAILGALLALGARHFVSDVYAQVGFVMLIGLASKNAILIVEFANQLRARGRDIVAAAVEAAETRFRPIVMTSLAFICAILPLLVASGAGSISRQSLGTTLFGGMIFASALNLTLVPVLYVVIVQLRERFGGRRKSHEHLDGQPSIRQGADGEVIFAFPNGGKPVELRVSTSPVLPDKE